MRKKNPQRKRKKKKKKLQTAIKMTPLAKITVVIIMKMVAAIAMTHV